MIHLFPYSVSYILLIQMTLVIYQVYVFFIYLYVHVVLNKRDLVIEKQLPY